MEKPKCEICNRTFKDLDGLEKHNLAKHHVEKKVERIENKEIKKYGIYFVVILLIAGGAYALFSGAQSCKNTPANEMNIGGHTNLALHIHQDLKIIIDGKEETIPPNIGIAPNIMRPIHTHDATGELHVEGQCKRDFTLGDFFVIWDKRFDSNCIFEHCTDKGKLKMSVNGKENFDFDKLALKDHDKILIEYRSN